MKQNKLYIFFFAMNTSLRYITLTIVICIFCIARAVTTPDMVNNPKTSNRECNIANPDLILSLSECDSLQTICNTAYSTAGVEMCIVAIDDIGDETTAFDFAIELFNKWGVGSKESNTGVLLLIVKKQRDIQIITGGGIEGVLPDARCGRILDDAINTIKSKGGNAYGAGLITAGNEILRYISTDSARKELLSEKEPTDDMQGLPWLLGGLCLAGAGIGATLYNSKRICKKCHKRGMKLISVNDTIKATPEHPGERIITFQCTKCGETERIFVQVPYKNDEHNDNNRGGGSSIGNIFGPFIGINIASRVGRGIIGGAFGGGNSFGGGAGKKF